jgi:hypothetical protein
VLFLAMIVGFCMVVGLAAAAWRLAIERDRLPAVWTVLSVVAAFAAGVASWSLFGRVDSGAGLVAGVFAVWGGPAAASAVVVATLYWLPPGVPWIAGSVAVRLMDGDREAGRLELGDEELSLVTGKGARRIARVDLERAQADGECLRLSLREGGQLRLLILEVDDPQRRRRLCEVLARTLTQAPTRARVMR